MPGTLKTKRNIKPIPGLAKRLKLARVNKGLSQLQAAKALGINSRAISQWEVAKSAPHTRKLQQVADLYSVTVDWLWNAAISDGPIPRVQRNAHQLTTQLSIPVIEKALNDNVKSLRDVATPWPRPFFERLIDESGAALKNIVIMKGRRDSMEPTIALRDYVLVDMSVNKIDSTRGIYVIHDGRAVMVRRVEATWSKTGEPIYRCTGDNPAVEPREVPEKKLRVLGQVIATFHYLY
jgi:transcriptional regulator with XRE-family HTH domain